MFNLTGLGNELKFVKIGKFNFTKGVIDVTDPCYNDDVWCRLNGIEIVPGEYDCWAIMNNEGRVVSSMIEGCNGDAWRFAEQFVYKGAIGVDAGLAGYFQDKPNYTDAEWSEFCDALGDGNAWINNCGFFTSSGYGDGEYAVFALEYSKNSRYDGKAIAVRIDFV